MEASGPADAGVALVRPAVDHWRSACQGVVVGWIDGRE